MTVIFCKNCLQCFSSENVLNEHRKYCLLINKGQNVKLEKRFISFKNFKRQSLYLSKFMLILNVY